MAWTVGSCALQALATLAIVGLAGVGVTAYDNSRFDNVGSLFIWIYLTYRTHAGLVFFE